MINLNGSKIDSLIISYAALPHYINLKSGSFSIGAQHVLMEINAESNARNARESACRFHVAH